MPDNPFHEQRISAGAKRLTLLAARASAEAVKLVNYDAAKHERAAMAHDAAALEWSEIDAGAQREHEKAARLERAMASAIRAYQGRDIRPMGVKD